jgi:hypothetical protein
MAQARATTAKVYPKPTGREYVLYILQASHGSLLIHMCCTVKCPLGFPTQAPYVLFQPPTLSPAQLCVVRPPLQILAKLESDIIHTQDIVGPSYRSSSVRPTDRDGLAS